MEIYVISLSLVLIGSISNLIKRNITSTIITVIGCVFLAIFKYNAGEMNWCVGWTILSALNFIALGMNINNLNKN